MVVKSCLFCCIGPSAINLLSSFASSSSSSSSSSSKRGRGEDREIKGPVRCSFILWGFLFLLLRGGGNFL